MLKFGHLSCQGLLFLPATIMATEVGLDIASALARLTRAEGARICVDKVQGPGGGGLGWGLRIAAHGFLCGQVGWRNVRNDEKEAVASCAKQVALIELRLGRLVI